MPTLHWVGKDKVVNHHHEVPFRVLKKEYSFRADAADAVGDAGLPPPPRKTVNTTDNRIIHGDNLEALKSLLPEFEGKVKCIYIDPPYNTGNEGWVYNDAVNDPKIKRWLGQVVGKEGEDLSRHDKWLCMMYPRLKLLHRLLADDGSIWVSIDDTEVATLRLLLDEVFGRNCFVASIVWRSSDNSNNDAKQFSTDHNHLLLYSRRPNWRPNTVRGDLSKRGHFKNPDNDPRGAWFDGNPLNSPKPRPNLKFSIVSPTGYQIKSPPNGWRWSQETINQKLATGEIRFTADGKGIRRRTYLDEMEPLPPSSLWIDFDETGHNRQAKSELKSLFSEVAASDLFSTPKPVRFVERLIELATIREGIILDSFAGSATTAHAALKLNAQDGGKRRFILIEMEGYAETITAERVRRVMHGYGEGTSAAGLGGGFDYYTVGEPMFLAEDILNEAVGVDAIRNYVAYSEGIPTEERTAHQNPHTPYLLGLNRETGWIFYYEPNRATSLDMSFLSGLRFGGETGAGKPATTIIYADRCLLSTAFMTRHGIVFKKIPRDITRF